MCENLNLNDIGRSPGTVGYLYAVQAVLELCFYRTENKGEERGSFKALGHQYLRSREKGLS